jgi:diguanylate cyclase (GGDEF)-like protein
MSMDAAPHNLPAELLREVRKTWVAPHLRGAVERLPQPVRLDAALHADASAVPLAARQLLKLTLSGDRVRLGSVREALPGEHVTLTLRRGERSLSMSTEELQGELRTVLTRLLGALFDASDVTHMLESLAFQSSSLSTLRQLTAKMLEATSIDEAQSLMLVGITSGHGLGFNRAALFVPSAVPDQFVGTKGIGPFDEAEAHRIWEEIELGDVTIEGTASDFVAHRQDSRFQEFVTGIVLRATQASDDEVRKIIAAESRAELFQAAQPANADLRRLTVSGEWVLAPVRSRGALRGVVFADNCYSGTRVSAEQMEHLALYTEQMALVLENLALLSRVAELASTDALTGLLNRREFDTRFEQERSRCLRSGAPLSLLIIDVDHFKQTNDKGGHAEGDRVLRTLGLLLKGAFRTHDLVARYGGDEFVVLLPDASTNHVAVAARRLGQYARDNGISLSVGGATWPDREPEAEALFAAADKDLYRAKNEGRGCAVVNGIKLEFTASVRPPGIP